MEQFQPVPNQLAGIQRFVLMSLSRWAAAILFMCGLLWFIFRYVAKAPNRHSRF
jgi:hypothetical protein